MQALEVRRLVVAVVLPPNIITIANVVLIGWSKVMRAARLIIFLLPTMKKTCSLGKLDSRWIVFERVLDVFCTLWMLKRRQKGCCQVVFFFNLRLHSRSSFERGRHRNVLFSKEAWSHIILLDVGITYQDWRLR